MTGACPACGHEFRGSACARCGFVSDPTTAVDLSKEWATASAKTEGIDTALFDATVARSSTTGSASRASQVGTLDPWQGRGVPGPAPWPSASQPSAVGTGAAAVPSTPEPAWASVPAPWQPVPPPPPHSTPTVSTVVAHLVLWLGLLALAAASRALGAALTDSGIGFQAAEVVYGLLGLLPIAVATVIAGRSATLRVIAVVGSLALVGGFVFLSVESSEVDAWPVRLAMCVLGLATWMTVRRHARSGYVLLVPAALLLLLWFPTFGPAADIVNLPYRHGVSSSFLLELWFDLPIVAMAGFGLASSFLKPMPARERDAIGWAVVGPLAMVVVLLIPITWVTSHRDTSYSGAGSSTPDYSSAATIDPSAAARMYLEAAEAGRSSAAGCNGEVPTLDVASYTIGQVSPATTGGFDVSATVTSPDGSVQTVTIHVGTDTTTAGSACVVDVAAPDYTSGGTSAAGGGFSAPDLPSSTDPVPSGSTVPQVSVTGDVISYTDSGRTPTTETQLVARVPSGLTADEQGAVQALIRFLTAINQQDFQAAWSASTYSTKAATYSSGFAAGYTTSRHYEVSFGQPQQLTPTLVAVPATFVSRQDPAAQGNPSGVTGCTYWPQYVFLAASVGGTWLDDTAGVFGDDPSIAGLKRIDTSRPGKAYLNPLSQRVAC